MDLRLTSTYTRQSAANYDLSATRTTAASDKAWMSLSLCFELATGLNIMLFLRQVFVVVFIGVTCTIAALPQNSNSQRLARGLPPLPPKFGRNRPGYPTQYYNPTPVFGVSLVPNILLGPLTFMYLSHRC